MSGTFLETLKAGSGNTFHLISHPPLAEDGHRLTQIMCGGFLSTMSLEQFFICKNIHIPSPVFGDTINNNTFDFFDSS